MRARRWRIGLALACAAGAIVAAAASAPARQDRPASASQSQDPAVVARGERLFLDGCSSCHGMDASGIRGRGPSLHGVGARSADFYLSTGRMPLDDPEDEPVRSKPAYTDMEIAALVAWVASLGGPPVPSVNPERGSVSEGFELFTENCAGCHQVVGRGGIVTGAVVPRLQQATPTQVAAAVRIGPYLMPEFGERQIDRAELDSLTRYVLETRHPDDRGGWGIGHIGPIPEGMVAWLLAGAALLLVARVIGERTE